MNIEAEHWWDDPNFLDNLISLLVQDYRSLTRVSGILESNDFKPIKGIQWGRARWVVATRALHFFTHYHEPIGSLLEADVLDYCFEIGFGQSQIADIRAYMVHLRKIKPKAPDALVEKVLKYKDGILKTQALREMEQLRSAGKLTDELWFDWTKKATSAFSRRETIQYTAKGSVQARIERRELQRYRTRVPYTFIDPLDALVTTVAPQQLGLVLAPYKRGKSMFLEWLAQAFARQRRNVLHVTLEDPRDIVEDRLDAMITAIPMKNLADKPRTLTRKFNRFKSMTRAGIEIYDGVAEEVTVPKIEAIVNDCRNRGFVPQVLLIDYDEKIQSLKHYAEKRFETDEVYKGVQGLCSRLNLIGWMAAQTQRDTRHLKILSGDKVAEDIGKMRKVTCGISLGKGEWTDNSIFLWVAAHKNDRMEVGCEIVPDLTRAMIYDEEMTRKAALAHADDDI